MFDGLKEGRTKELKHIEEEVRITGAVTVEWTKRNTNIKC